MVELTRQMERRRSVGLAGRIFMAVTGSITVMSSTYILALTVWRITGHPAPSRPLVLTIVFSIAFVSASLLQGVAWILIALGYGRWKQVISSTS